jgi:hypothetical protein
VPHCNDSQDELHTNLISGSSEIPFIGFGSRESLLTVALQCRLSNPHYGRLRGSLNRRVAYVSRHDGKAVESL